VNPVIHDVEIAVQFEELCELYDVTDSKAVKELIDANSVDILAYISWDEVCHDVG